jgi:hypothetical protein
MKMRKEFHPASSTVRRFLCPIKVGYAQRKSVGQSAPHNSAARRIPAPPAEPCRKQARKQVPQHKAFFALSV